MVTMDNQTSSQESPLPALQALIERHIQRVDDLKGKLKELTGSMKSIVENSAELTDVQQKAEELVKEVKEKKKKLTESQEFRELRTKTVELKDELKELEEALNNHLLSYYKHTGVKVVDLSGGIQRAFKVIARVLPKKHNEEGEA